MTIHKVNNKGGKILRSGLSSGKSIIVPSTEIIQSPQTSKLRRGLGIALQPITYQVISLPPPSTIPGILQSKILWGWSGNSTTSDIKATGYSDLTVAGTVQSGTKKVGANAFSYTGGDNSAIGFRINETLKDTVDTANGYSIACWCRWNSFNFAGPWGMYAAQLVSDDGIVTAANNTGSSSSVLLFTAIANNQTVLVTCPSIQSLSINTWYHFVFEINDTFLRLYINGVLENTSASFSNTIDFWGTAENFRLAGYAANTSTTQLNGYLDEFYIIAGTLSQPEIDYLYNSGNGNTLI